MNTQNEAVPLPEGYNLPAPRRPSPADEAAASPDPRFAQFSEMCAAFGRMISADRSLTGSSPRGKTAERNLAIARTVFAKWGMEIMIVLYAEPEGLGFERLRRELAGISPRVLSLKLKTLEAQGLVSRKVLAERPPRVSYTLTPTGCDLARMAEPVFLFLDELLTSRDAEKDSPSSLAPPADTRPLDEGGPPPSTP
jgi:DNA-binding HxlR family transcriptional regulator